MSFFGRLWPLVKRRKIPKPDLAPSTGGELAPVKGDIEIGLEELNLVVCPVIYEQVSVPTPPYFASRSGLVSLKNRGFTGKFRAFGPI